MQRKLKRTAMVPDHFIFGILKEILSRSSITHQSASAFPFADLDFEQLPFFVANVCIEFGRFGIRWDFGKFFELFFYARMPHTSHKIFEVLIFSSI